MHLRMQLSGNFSLLVLNLNPSVRSALATTVAENFQEALMQLFPGIFDYQDRHPSCNRFVQVSAKAAAFQIETLFSVDQP
jgi:hypothetical protein